MSTETLGNKDRDTKTATRRQESTTKRCKTDTRKCKRTTETLKKNSNDAKITTKRQDIILKKELILPHKFYNKEHVMSAPPVEICCVLIKHQSQHESF